MNDHQGRVNRGTFDDPDVLATYSRGWTDLGERRMMRHVAGQVAGRPVLDLGVGTGRTIPLLTKHVGGAYSALDYSPNSVAECRRLFPEADVRLGDARDLSQFEAGSFGLVNFSFNGIDAVNHEERQLVLGGMTRLAAKDGLVWYSTLNLDSFYSTAKPWRLDARGLPLRLRPSGLGPWLLVAPRQLPRYVRTYRNWMRVRGHEVEGDGWAVRPLQADEFRLLAHFTSLTEVRRELAEHGLEPDRIIGSSGDELTEADASNDPYMHICARRS